MSTEDVLRILASQSNNVDAEQTKLQQLAAQPIRRAFLEPGQSGMDMLRNPNQEQNSALLQAGLAMLGSDPRNPAKGMSEGISAGLNLHGAMKEQNRGQALGAQELAVQGAQGRFDRTGDIARSLPKTPTRKTTVQERVDDQGNKRNILIDSQTGEDIRDLGISSLGVSPKDQAAMAKGDEKQAMRAKGHITSANNVLGEITGARDLVNQWATTGIAGQVLGKVGGTDARNLQAKLTSIKANLGFDRLQEMRESSPTGGALGQVAVQELIALQSTVASLDQAQSDEYLLSALDKIEKHYTRWIQTLQGQMPEGGDDPLGIRS